MEIQNGGMMKEFEDLFLQLTKQHDNSVVFNDFLDYSVDMFRIDYNEKHFKHETYTKEEHTIFYDLLTHLITHTNEVLNQDDSVGWYDMLGDFYENVIQSKWKAGTRGQFYTPVAVVEALADLTVNTHKEGKVYDGACGSSRTLLAYHTRRPYDICIGGDLDYTSCLMSVINFVLHGVKGVILNMDSLSGDFYGAWKVNEYVDYGLPFTVEYTKEQEGLV